MEYFDLLVEHHPEQATALSIHARDQDLDDRTAPAVARRLARRAELLASLRARFADETVLSATSRTDLNLLVHTLAAELAWEREVRPAERKPDFYTEPLESLFLMTARSYAPAAQRAKDVLARMEKLPQTLAAARANLKNPPRVWTQVGIEKAASAGPFFDQVKTFLDGALPAEKRRTEAAVRAAKEAHDAYKNYLERDLLPHSTSDFAVGRDLFDFLLREAHFLEEDSEALRAMGQRVVARTQQQMTEVARKIDPAASGWPEVVAALKRKHPKANDVLPAYRREVARARAFLVAKDVVPFPPGDELEVVETPPFLRSTTSASYEMPAPFEAGGKGMFFVTPVEKSWSAERQEEWLRENDWGDIVDTAVHEAYPGHHLQLSWSRRHPSLIRKLVDSSIFAEGWALYGEELMAELGYYDDEKRLMQLEWLLVRAARVVIDVGLHTRGMSVDEAVRMLTDEVHLEKSLAVNEVKRYTMNPTQPLSYVVGREAIFKLRAELQRREGASFSLKRFHTELLSRGTIPPGLIARELLGGS